jgi:hypothetical protein
MNNTKPKLTNISSSENGVHAISPREYGSYTNYIETRGKSGGAVIPPPTAIKVGADKNHMINGDN